MIKNISNSFISDYTKNLIRWHYLIRGITKALDKSKDKEREEKDRLYWKGEYVRQKEVWE